VSAQVYSTPFNKAFAGGDSSPAYCQNASPTFTYPDSRVIEPTADGYYSAGQGGAVAVQQLLLLPYCYGPPNSDWYMRVYGWWKAGREGDREVVTWLPLLLAELYCIAGTFSGPGGLRRFINDQEFFAKTCTVSAGNLGQFGGVLGGSDISYVKLDLQGCQGFSFDCAQSTTGTFGNCLWSRTSAL
jgi:hypothetical protein